MAKQLVAIQSSEFGPHAVLHSSKLTHRGCHKHLDPIIIVCLFLHPNCWANIVLLDKRIAFVLRYGLCGNPAIFGSMIERSEKNDNWLVNPKHTTHKKILFGMRC